MLLHSRCVGEGLWERVRRNKHITRDSHEWREVEAKVAGSKQLAGVADHASEEQGGEQKTWTGNDLRR